MAQRDRPAAPQAPRRSAPSPTDITDGPHLPPSGTEYQIRSSHHPLAPAPISLSVTDSPCLAMDLLGTSASSLPDPRHFARGRRKHNYYVWTAVWCTAISLCLPCSPRTLPTGLGSRLGHMDHHRQFLLGRGNGQLGSSLFHTLIPCIPDWLGYRHRLFATIPIILEFITGRRLIHRPWEVYNTSVTCTIPLPSFLHSPRPFSLSPSSPRSILILIFHLTGYFPHPLGHGNDASPEESFA